MEEKQISYSEYLTNVMHHRKLAGKQTRQKIAKAVELELIALREIADCYCDWNTQQKIIRRIERIENILL